MSRSSFARRAAGAAGRCSPRRGASLADVLLVMGALAVLLVGALVFYARRRPAESSPPPEVTGDAAAEAFVPASGPADRAGSDITTRPDPDAAGRQVGSAGSAYGDDVAVEGEEPTTHSVTDETGSAYEDDYSSDDDECPT